MRKLFFLLVIAISLVSLANAGSVIIVNADGPGEGFNDATPAAPVGGNSGTTVGQQRLIAFQYAASIWEAVLNSPVDIHIRARFDALACDATSAVLGQAGTTALFSDFAGAPVAGTWYPVALANKLANTDLNPPSRSSDGAEINAQFNSSIGQTGCLEGSGWYYGLDGNEGNKIDLAAVLLHEFGHGFGFASYVDETNGGGIKGKIDIFSTHLLDLTTNQTWGQMGNTERKQSAINSRNLVWDGNNVRSAIASGVLAPGVPSVRITSPNSAVYDAGEASFGPALTTRGVSQQIVQALDAGGAGTTTDACEAITNPAAVNGKIALVDRGTCTFVTKALNVQAAGAVAMIVVDNTSNTPADSLGSAEGAQNVNIPAVRVTLADGNAIKSQLGSGVQGTVGLDDTRIAGAANGFAQLYAPNPVNPGSSVSHWDTIARPNQLMEPFINDDLTHSVVINPSKKSGGRPDLTYELLKDIGW